MLTVVIIDDEVLVRIGLKSIINWEENDCQIIAEASNGQQGLEIIQRFKPDIVITDIKMPVMDGIELIQQVMELKGTRFIVLSSYDEFHLVRQAMKLGAVEYLIKLELGPEVLLNAISQIKIKICEEQAEAYKRKSLERHVRLNKPVLREEFFKKLIGRIFIERSDLEENIRLLEINLNENALICVFIKIYDTGGMENFGREDIQLFDFSVVNIIDEILNDFFNSYAFGWSLGEYVAVFSCREDCNGELLRRKISETLQRLIQMLKQYFNILVSVGISDLHNGFKELGDAFLESSEALQYEFYRGSGNFIFYNECKSRQENTDSIQILNYKNRLRKAVELADIKEVKTVFEQMALLLSMENVTREKAFDVCYQIAYLVSDLIGDKDLNMVQGQAGSIYAEISKQNSLTEIVNWIRKLGLTLVGMLERSLEKQNHRLILKAKKYINEHLKEEIKLCELADFLGLSAGYLSTLFKQITKKNFIDYVTEVKIDYAKVLLKESGLKVYEVSKMVGFENAYYFSRVFRKVTEMTPREYLEKNL